MVSKQERERIIGSGSPSGKHSLNQRKLKAGREGEDRAFGGRHKIVKKIMRRKRIQEQLLLEEPRELQHGEETETIINERMS